MQQLKVHSDRLQVSQICFGDRSVKTELFTILGGAEVIWQVTAEAVFKYVSGSLAPVYSNGS